MRVLSGFAVIMIGVMSFAYFMPYFYGIAAVKKPYAPNVFFSPVIEDFIMIKSGKDTSYCDRVGNIYDLNEFKKLAPFVYYRDLQMKGEYPDIIGGVFVPFETVQKETDFISVRPSDINHSGTRIGLYPLYDTKSDSASLEFPGELFRIKERMEFINASSIETDEEKSELFTGALREKGFVFPAKVIGGNTDPRKQTDYGYFVADSSGFLFRVYQAEGRPEVVKTGFGPENGEIVHIYANEKPGVRYYCFIITREGGIYALMKEDYSVRKVPAGNYNPYADTLRISADPLYITAKVSDGSTERVSAAGWDFTERAVYSSLSDDSMKSGMKAVFHVIFPFYIYDDKNAPSFPLKASLSEKPAAAFVFSLILAAAYFIISVRSGNRRPPYGASFIILLTGIYGLAAVLILNNGRRR